MKIFKKIFSILFIFLLGSAGMLFADWSGVMDNTVNYSLGNDGFDSQSFGLETFANFRYQVRTREMATFYASFNLVAASGTNALGLGFIFGETAIGENYAAGIELERLYFRIPGEKIRTEAGLLRMSFGYSQVWGSTDFLNPRNPMILNARPRGVLGWHSSMFITDELRIMAFAAAPSNPLLSDGGGFIPGLSMDRLWDTGSLLGFYAFQTPNGPYKQGLHYFGLSLKFDLELSFVVDAHYSLNPEDINGLDGLSASVGFDYSFLDGDLFILTEYLYNGSASVTSAGNGGHWLSEHFLYCSALYRMDDFTNFTLALMMSFDDLSFRPIAIINHELFQGFSMSLSAQLPLDQKSFGGSKAGELVEAVNGARTTFVMSLGARLRF